MICNQVHGWLLRVGTIQAARQAVALWEGLQQKGRLTDDIAEGHALAQLHLARLLLRGVVGEQQPSVAAPQQPTPASSKRSKEKERPKEKASVKEQGGQVQMQPPNDNVDPDTSATASKSYAAAAATATADQLASGDTKGAAAAPGGDNEGWNAAALVAQAGPLPTAGLAGLQQLIANQPDYQAQVDEALRTLAEAKQTFINYKQHAGASLDGSIITEDQFLDGVTARSCCC